MEKKLSIKRVILAVFMLAGVACSGFLLWERYMDIKAARAYKPWFAPYVDVTATPTYSFESQTKNAILSFIVSLKTDECTPSWGGVYTLDEANRILDLDRRIARLKNDGGAIAVSFGGLLNDELAMNCKDIDKLKSAYKLVIDHYDIDTVDLDIEGEALRNTESLVRRAKAIAGLQDELAKEDRRLKVWLTLPVATSGLTPEGVEAVAAMLENGVELTGVNVMTMNYAESKNGRSMQEASKQALIETRRQLGVLYGKVGIKFGNATLWAKIGATPMIGQNDVVGEIFTLEDARSFNNWAKAQGIGRISMWSANRDVACGDNYANINMVSDACSGTTQQKGDFAKTLGEGFEGSIRDFAPAYTQAPQASVSDDPATSPYQIWSKTATYLAGTKVVWRRHVYQAKWWTRGDIPDNPVLQSWETPWQLIGPVLPGETPIPLPTLPPGTYPEWSGTEIYEEGQRVLFEGVPYEAKWWTQGDSPAASTSDPDGSPWIMLTQDEVEEILNSERI